MRQRLEQRQKQKQRQRKTETARGRGRKRQLMRDRDKIEEIEKMERSIKENIMIMPKAILIFH